MDFNREEIVVVGGAGFVGTRLCEYFDQKSYKYTIGDVNTENRPDKTIYLDVEDVKSLGQLQGASTIFNLAAVHSDDVQPLSRYYDVNVQGALNICNAARAQSVRRIVFTSSVAIYGFAPEETDESGHANYFNEYGRTKYLAEAVYRQWQAEDPTNRTLVIVRPTVIFGEGNRGNVYNLLKQISLRRFVMFGSGKNRKSMAYVENVAAFLAYSLKLPPGAHTYNYIDKPDFDMNSLVSATRNTLFGKETVGFRLPAVLGMFIGYFFDAVAKIMGRPLPISSIRVKKFMGTTRFSSSISETGFVPPVPINEGLVKTLRYEFLENNSDQRTFNTE